MAFFDDRVIARDTNELEQHLGAAAQQVTSWAVEVQRALLGIKENTRGLLWWTSMVSAVIVSLFLVAALNSLRRVMVDINKHQALFRRMWEEDRANEEKLRQEAENRRARRRAQEAIHRREAAQAQARRNGGNAGAQRGIADGAAPGNNAAESSTAAAVAGARESRRRQMDAEIEILAARGPPDGAPERQEYLRRIAAEMRVKYPELFVADDNPEDPEDWRVSSDEESADEG
ncbi:hypothetical protein DL766_001015 [Monosporascus sp. MC13-8B]|uniref:Uncharacterized protein n=1 Tax=Monosporascus cannonballus TaxID=155416 RepID=A0ABY0H795_9PEZI|nr:hypothetical protein DL763_010659 [Monosporascus cannonballus]RYO86358.1 hypothetical protein DL762_004774 [Monosporascus cannonballus]RYP38306.1 hypothetical protein DL766_001015 [Monosporascus sp. MC13-8B]